MQSGIHPPNPQWKYSYALTSGTALSTIPLNQQPKATKRNAARPASLQISIPPSTFFRSLHLSLQAPFPENSQNNRDKAHPNHNKQLIIQYNTNT